MVHINSYYIEQLKQLIYSFNLLSDKKVKQLQGLLKNAEYIPIYKTGKKYCFPNYKPIFLISNSAKNLKNVYKMEQFHRKM